MKAKKIVLLLIICTCVLSGSCPGFDSRDSLQSGQQTIIQGNLNNEFDHTYQTPVNFRIGSDFDIAITTSKIADYNQLPKTGFGYNIEGHRVGLTNLIQYKITIKKDGSWSSIQLSYLVSGRPDLALGNLQFNHLQWIPQGQNIYTVLSTIQKDLPNTNYQMTAFISGFSIADPQLILTISRAALNERRLQIIFYTSASLPALSLTISYVIYPETHQFLQISFGPQLADQNGGYQISGPVDFRADKTVQYRQWRVSNRNLACASNQCSGSCVLKEECLAKGGNVENGTCTYCPPGIVFENGQCSKRCKSSWLSLYGLCSCPNGSKLKGKECVNDQGCGSLQRYVESSQKCECKQGYARINSICIQCPANSTVSPSGQSCTCSNNQLHDVKSNTCRNRCSQNQEWIGNKCECLQNHIWWNQQCRKCPSNSYQTLNHQTCICKNKTAAFNPETNKCIECGGENYQIINNKCTCKNGYKNSILNKKQYCQFDSPCEPGFYLDATICSRCVDNCILCESGFKCYKCSLGYETKPLTIQGQTFVVCDQVCGDGIGGQLGCDDGNKVDGDGCSSQCEVEEGWQCRNDQPASKSICHIFDPNRFYLSVKGVVNLGDRVILNVIATSLPPCVTQNQCKICDKILNITVTGLTIPYLIKVKFIPQSQYQFHIEYNLLENILTSAFNTTIKLSQKYAGCFSDEDLKQKIDVRIDSTFDYPRDKYELSLDEVMNGIPVSGQKALG